jgi:hypothetical protein
MWHGGDRENPFDPGVHNDAYHPGDILVLGAEMTAPKMTRKRALELAQECVGFVMRDTYAKIKQDSAYEKRYAELAAALKLIEHMSRQGEMHL